MLAAITVGLRVPLVVEDVILRDPGAHELRVRVLAVGVCRSDLALWEGHRPHVATPAVCGHEVYGVVEQVGSEVTRVRAGDAVVGSPVPCCGQCYYCLRGLASYCEELSRVAGAPPPFRRRDGKTVPSYTLGAFAEEMILHELSAIPVNTELPPAQAALLGCAVLTGTGSVFNATNVRPGETVLVQGCGGVGLIAVAAARIAGAGVIIAVDPLANKRAAARDMGATHTLNPAEQQVGEFARTVTGGHGVDHALDFTGKPALLRAAYDATRAGGTTVAVGSSSTEPDFRVSPFELVNGGAKRLVGCRMGNGNPLFDIPRAASLAEAGLLDLGRLVSAETSLDQIQDCYDTLLDGSALRNVIVF